MPVEGVMSSKKIYDVHVQCTCTSDLYCSMQCVIVPLKQYDDDNDDVFCYLSSTCLCVIN